MTSSGRGQIDKAVTYRSPKRHPISRRCQRTNSATAYPGEPGARALLNSIEKLTSGQSSRKRGYADAVLMTCLDPLSVVEAPKAVTC